MIKTMKKAAVLQTILSVTLAAFLLCGCDNSTDTEEKEEETKATTATTASDIHAFWDYAKSLSEQTLLIYNGSEGYVINMGEGKYYQLKGNDGISENFSDRGTGKTDRLEAGGGTNISGNLYEMCRIIQSVLNRIKYVLKYILLRNIKTGYVSFLSAILMYLLNKD